MQDTEQPAQNIQQSAQNVNQPVQSADQSAQNVNQPAPGTDQPVQSADQPARGVNQPAQDMEQLYRAHAKAVYKFLLVQCHNESLAEELTQETFYQAVRSINRFDGSCKVSVWLCQIAKHLWYRYLRKHKREVPADDELPDLISASAENVALERDAYLRTLKQIHGLPDTAREVMYLRIFGDLSFKEIGDVLGKTETWARVTFYRSKETIKGEIQ